MVTRMLHACGLYLGRKEELMPAQADNPDGFWEHLGFVALNDQLLNELGGAWDLPPNANENFRQPRLDPLRSKARLLVEAFDSARVWGWKDPRNSLTLPFWQDLLAGLKTLIVVRNPLEMAYSMRQRNGTSYSFALRLWEIYNRRLLEAAKKQERLFTHYDLFFQDAETELRRIANFIGLPDAKIQSAAKLVATQRRHTHFTIEQLIDARVAEEVIELYRALIAETSVGRRNAAPTSKGAQAAKADEVDLLPGAVSRLNAFVPERLAQIEHLYGELLAQTETRHKAEIENLSEHPAQTEARHKSQVEELVAHYNGEIQQLNARIMEMNDLLRERSVNLAEDEKYIGELTDQLRKQLQSTRRLSRLLEETEHAARRLRTSRRWKLANPGATLKAKLSHGEIS